MGANAATASGAAAIGFKRNIAVDLAVMPSGTSRLRPPTLVLWDSLRASSAELNRNEGAPRRPAGDNNDAAFVHLPDLAVEPINGSSDSIVLSARESQGRCSVMPNPTMSTTSDISLSNRTTCAIVISPEGEPFSATLQNALSRTYGMQSAA